MTAYSIDAVVIGAGVVGLAVARRLALAGRETLVIEAADAIGTGTSSRNSEVIHAALYYPTGSLKAAACLRGKELLYRYAADRGVSTENCGKLMVATETSQLPKLRAIWDQAHANGVTGLAWMTPEDVRAIEPEVACVKAFMSGTTGIVDSHGLMLALQGDLEDAGGMVAFETPVLSAEIAANGIVLQTGGAAPAEIATPMLVNAAGHFAPKFLRDLKDFPADWIPRQWYAKGNYFALTGRQPFSRLVYPMPDAAGLGVHATIDLQGRCRFGPDVEWVENEHDLVVDPARAAGFYAAIRSYWPGLPDDALQPDYAGIRPKLHGPGTPMPDFRVDGPEAHGISGLVNLLGIESPGLTASLALADIVAKRLGLPVLETV
ncbi:NAD(P)/FAD-dependent oxidoreductase [Phreatobacter sp. AB_2022a]|uniref:NAD(P)/FAD-dependent oxidoreductase n=1 Tax=Phreatobacter sp. AB_2022a TaxID=3003134 RepID=UPI0022874514|nr:NAD(P)/FAD-dependent oxidoreductase [Phreatobacter sp. AB_2022a]MCZ0737601.1 NAD(P)/FAD-dependent oxidoreductase [Phreatobacter sp. AB_2022a]